MIPVNIPKNIVSGDDCLKLCCPWQTESAIIKQNELLVNEDCVLEIGSGGSTLFYGKRCERVTSIETEENWYKTVFMRLQQENLSNVNYGIIEEENDICDFIKNSATDLATVFLVDTVAGYNRSKILNAFLDKGISKNLRMIVMDNYSAPQLFPDHFDKELNLGEGWQTFTYNHPEWWGGGTRLYIKL